MVWKSVALACHLLLQKPSVSTHGNVSHLERRLSLWRNGKITDLLQESLCIQAHLSAAAHHKHLPDSNRELDDTLFSRLVGAGKTHSAARMVYSGASGGVLALDDVADPSTGKTVREVLSEKHPPPAAASSDALLDDGAPTNVDTPFNPIIFAKLTADLVKTVSRSMSGAAGPSGLDADAWKRMLTCFDKASNSLCLALAGAAVRLCTEEVPSGDLEAFTAARLIPLDKNPGVRPIAVGEVFRRIICKAIMKVVEYDILSATAPLQLCVGVPSACEAAVHAMESLFTRPETQGVLLVDATNAFNGLNRNVALENVPKICPALGRVFTNTYRDDIRLFVAGGGELASREGTCQGDPLAMGIYAVAIMPLIKHLEQACPEVTQSWYADDDSAVGSVSTLRSYWTAICSAGPGYGYHPHPSKSILLVKEEFFDEASAAFRGTGLRVLTSGARFLGGVIGTSQYKMQYTESLIAKWECQVQRLAGLAATQPHAAYSVFVRCIAAKWRFFLRAVECNPELLRRLDDIIDNALLPALSGQSLPADSPVRQLMSLPARFGGMAIPVVVDEAPSEYRRATATVKSIVNVIAPPPPDDAPHLTPAPITDGPQLSPGPIAASLHDAPEVLIPAMVTAISDSRAASQYGRQEKVRQTLATVTALKPDLSPSQHLLTEIAQEKGVSSWVTAVPSSADNTVLNKSDFRDAVCLRYGFPLEGLPTTCVCGRPMSTDHAMTCPCGGYPAARHDQVRDTIADVLREVVRDVEVEPHLLPCDGEALAGRTANRSPEARLDIRARGFWTRQQDAFFDVRVTHPRSNLLTRSEVLSQLAANERQKKRQYGERVNVVDRGVFSPLVFSTSGVCAKECSVFLKSLASLVAEKNVDVPYSVIMNVLRCKLSFCLLRWSITCFRGCRASFKRSPHSFVAQCRLACR